MGWLLLIVGALSLITGGVLAWHWLPRQHERNLAEQNRKELRRQLDADAAAAKKEIESLDDKRAFDRFKNKFGKGGGQ